MKRFDVCCPFCGTSIQSGQKSRGNCPNCAGAFSALGETLEWKLLGSAGGAAPREHSVGTLTKIRRVASALADPLLNPYSPLARHSRRRVSEYYDWILRTDEAAREWRTHFLRGVDLPPRADVLDHGCGQGRIVALAMGSGFNVAAQDVYRHPWWANLAGATFQVAPPNAPYLPWKSGSFELVMDFGVLGHIPSEVLPRFVCEVFRVLRPGGHWIIQEANSTGWGAHVTRRYYGRSLHSLQTVSHIAGSHGFAVTDYWYEGFQSFVFPRFLYYLRKILLSKRFNFADHDSRLAKLLPDTRRRQWVLRLQRPVAS